MRRFNARLFAYVPGAAMSQLVRRRFRDLQHLAVRKVADVHGQDDDEHEGQILHVLTIFRASAGQVPIGSTIDTATPTLLMVASPSEAVNLHRVLGDWSETTAT